MPVASVPVTVIVCTPVAAVDPTVSVTVADTPGVIDAGEIKIVTPDALLAVSAIALFPPPPSVTLKVNFVVPPICAVPELADSLKLKSTLVVVIGLDHSFTNTAPSTDPSPVARLYVPPLAVNPVTPGTPLLPEGVA